jgi:hypothetical protein
MSRLRQEEGLRGPLKGSDRAGVVGECRFEMSEDLNQGRQLRTGLLTGKSIALHRWNARRRTTTGQDRSQERLSLFESLPDSVPRALGEWTTETSEGFDDAQPVSDALEEFPETAGLEIESPDLLSRPDAEGSSAAIVPSFAVVAKESVGSHAAIASVTLVVATKITVTNQGADLLAVRTWCLFEGLDDRDLFNRRRNEPWNHGREKPRMPQNGSTAIIAIVRHDRGRGRSEVR